MSSKKEVKEIIETRNEADLEKLEKSKCFASLPDKNGSCIPDEVKEVKIDDIHRMRVPNHAGNGPEKVEDVVEDCAGTGVDVCVRDKVKEKTGVRIPIEFYKKAESSQSAKKTVPLTLISNFEIRDVMNRIEARYPEFYGYDFGFSDFGTGYEHEAKLTKNPPSLKNFVPEHSNFIQEATKKPIKCWGIVVNTDEHGSGGTHWFALFIDMRKKPYTIEHFNSSGNPPMEKIQLYINGLKLKWLTDREIEALSDVADFSNVGVMHQLGKTECGLYSMYYIFARVAGVPTSAFISQNKEIRDAEMTNFRPILFE